MKKSKWRMFQIIQLILFLGISIFLFFRKVDGSGAENTTDVKLISLAIWLGFYLFVLAIEYGVNKNRKKIITNSKLYRNRRMNIQI